MEPMVGSEVRADSAGERGRGATVFRTVRHPQSDVCTCPRPWPGLIRRIKAAQNKHRRRYKCCATGPRMAPAPSQTAVLRDPPTSPDSQGGAPTLRSWCVRTQAIFTHGAPSAERKGASGVPLCVSSPDPCGRAPEGVCVWGTPRAGRKRGEQWASMSHKNTQASAPSVRALTHRNQTGRVSRATALRSGRNTRRALAPVLMQIRLITDP